MAAEGTWPRGEAAAEPGTIAQTPPSWRPLEVQTLMAAEGAWPRGEAAAEPGTIAQTPPSWRPLEVRTLMAAEGAWPRGEAAAEPGTIAQTPPSWRPLEVQTLMAAEGAWPRGEAAAEPGTTGQTPRRRKPQEARTLMAAEGAWPWGEAAAEPGAIAQTPRRRKPQEARTLMAAEGAWPQEAAAEPGKLRKLLGDENRRGSGHRWRLRWRGRRERRRRCGRHRLHRLRGRRRGRPEQLRELSRFGSRRGWRRRRRGSTGFSMGWLLPCAYWGSVEHYDPRVEVEWGYGSLLGERDIMMHSFNYPLHWMPMAMIREGVEPYLPADKAVKMVAATMIPYAGDEFMMDYGEGSTGIYSNHKVKQVAWHRHYERFWIDSTGFCGWRWPMFFTNNTADKQGATPEAEPKFWNAVTGKNITFAEGMEIGRKIWNLDKSIWVLQGRHRDQEVFPVITFTTSHPKHASCPFLKMASGLTAQMRAEKTRQGQIRGMENQVL